MGYEIRIKVAAAAAVSNRTSTGGFVWADAMVDLYKPSHASEILKLVNKHKTKPGDEDAVYELCLNEDMTEEIKVEYDAYGDAFTLCPIMDVVRAIQTDMEDHEYRRNTIAFAMLREYAKQIPEAMCYFEGH